MEHLFVLGVSKGAEHLKHCMEKGEYALASLLLEHGADNDGLVLNPGDTPPHVALSIALGKRGTAFRFCPSTHSSLLNLTIVFLFSVERIIHFYTYMQQNKGTMHMNKYMIHWAVA